jgi:hypothetical protein
MFMRHLITLESNFKPYQSSHESSLCYKIFHSTSNYSTGGVESKFKNRRKRRGKKSSQHSSHIVHIKEGELPTLKTCPSRVGKSASRQKFISETVARCILTQGVYTKRRIKRVLPDSQTITRRRQSAPRL